MTNRKPRFEIHVDTRLLYQALTEVPVGGTITYAQLSAVISREVEGRNYNLQSALRMARRDNNILFDNILGVGYRRMTDAEIVADSANDISTIRRRAKRSAEKLFKVSDFDSLTADEKVKHATSASVFSAVAQSLSAKGLNAIEGAVKAVGKEIPVAETLRLFAK